MHGSIPGTLLLATSILCCAARVAFGAHPLSQWHQRLSLPSGSLGFTDVTWADGRFVAVANGSVATSTNGADWSLHPTGIQGFIQAVAHGNDRYVAVGLNGVGISSTDGILWSQHTTDPNGILDLHDVIYGNGLFVAVGESGRIVTSPDGMAWTPQDSGTPFNLQHLVHGRGLFLASLSLGTNLVSADGTNWQRRASGTAAGLYAVGFGGGQFLAVDTARKVWTSPDATVWTFHGAIAGIRPPEVGWGNGQFLILANPAPEYLGGAGLWTRSATNIAASGVAFGHGTFVLTAGLSIFQSDPVIQLGMAEPGALSLAGPPGQYRVEGADVFTGAWQSLTNFPLISSPAIWRDTPTNGSGRLYRAILQP